MKALDLVGQRFGRLVVQERVESDIKRSTFFECLCDCGSTIIATGSNLRRGGYTSCGCYRRSVKATHGMHNTTEYNIWRQMLQRCTNPKARYFENYGGRGITVCEEWTTFESFFRDMGFRPSLNHTIDRIDNGKGYNKENCRWATAAEQSRNTTRNRNFTINGKTQCITDWAKQLGCTTQSIKCRLRSGWTEEEAFTTPIQARYESQKPWNLAA